MQYQAPTNPNQLPSGLLPFKILAHGNAWLLLYTVGLSSISIILAQHLYQILSDYLLLVQTEHNLAFDYFKHSLFAAKILSYLVFTPVILVAVALPVRIVWIHGSISVRQLINESWRSLRYCIMTIYFCLYHAIYLIVPLAAMIALYFIFVEKQKSSSLTQIYYLATILIGISVFFKVLPLLSASFISICGQIRPLDAIGMCKDYFENLNLAVCTWIWFGFFATGAIYLVANNFAISTAPAMTTNQLALFGFLTWYVLTGICTSVLKAINKKILTGTAGF